MASDTFITNLSSFCSITGTFAVTTALLSVSLSSEREMVPKSVLPLIEADERFIVVSLNPINDIFTKQSSVLMASSLKVPFS